MGNKTKMQKGKIGIIISANITQIKHITYYIFYESMKKGEC